MMNDHVKEGFDHLLIKALKDSFGSASAEIEISVDTADETFAETHVILFTISSYMFRLMVILYFTPDDATKAYFAGIRNVPAADMDDQALLDNVSESGNLCCGILSRELGKFFPHIGMSTPNTIDKESMHYLRSLAYGHLQHFRINLANMANMHVSLCVFDYDDLDFAVEIAEESAETGELELF